MATLTTKKPVATIYELSLTLEEAQLLRSIVGTNVIGSGVQRQILNAIYEALQYVPDSCVRYGGIVDLSDTKVETRF